MNDGKIEVMFFVGKRRYGVRYWFAVPRKGDEVMLGDKDRQNDPHGKAPFKVVRVVWGVEAPDGKRQSVNVEIKPID